MDFKNTDRPFIEDSAKSQDLVYQNGSKFRLVIITVQSNINSDLDEASFDLLVDTDDPPTTQKYINTLHDLTIPRSDELEVTNQVVYLIPPHYYYELVDTSTGGGTIIIRNWAEVDLF